MSRVVSYLMALCTFLLLLSCVGDRIECMEIPVAVNRAGDVAPPLIVRNTKTVVTYFTPGGMGFSLDGTPRGKIDRIIRDNPDWQFLFYVDCSPKWKNTVIHYLNEYDCNFPVMLDYEGKFKQKNLVQKDLTGIGFILDADSRQLGCSVIGDSRSLFDSEFKKAKRMAK